MVQPRRVAIMPPLRPLAIRLHKADGMHTQLRFFSTISGAENSIELNTVRPSPEKVALLGQMWGKISAA
jgi:hypothetical protein